MSILIASVFVVIGVLIKYGKFYNLIAGYNTLSKEEKEKYDIERIGNLFLGVMIFMAVIVLIGYVLSKVYNNFNIELTFLFISNMLGIPYLLIKANSKKYKKDS